MRFVSVVAFMCLCGLFLSYRVMLYAFFFFKIVVLCVSCVIACLSAVFD